MPFAHRASSDRYETISLPDGLEQVRLIARRIQRNLPSHVEYDELVSEGTLGLLRAARDFDPGRGVKFRTYAEHRIRGAIYDALRRVDPLSRTQRRRWREAEVIAASLRQALARDAEAEEVANALRMPLPDWLKLRRVVEESGVLSHASPSGGDRRPQPEPSWSRTEVNPEQLCARAELSYLLCEALRQLRGDEQFVLRLRYVEGHPVAAIACLLSRHPSRISQLHATALRRLRSLLKPVVDGQTTPAAAWLKQRSRDGERA